ncbi:MAG: hypothetical protein Kow0037_18240 [Calditrichia bacterium]
MNEARISLTPFCNYRCFFCHNEGLQKGKDRKPAAAEVYNLCRELLSGGICPRGTCPG